MSKVNDIIEKGAVAIPADVLGVVDRGGASATRVESGWLTALCVQPGARCSGHADADVLGFGPLTVTAVREPEPQRGEAHAFKPNVLGQVCGRAIGGGIFCGQVAASPVHRIPPQQADAPALLDLVRQYGQRCTEAGSTEWADIAEEGERRAAELFDRIAALVPHGVVPDGAVGDGPCHDCGAVNIRWYADSPIWNHVMGGPEARDDPGGILCICCFVVRAFAAGYNPSAWRVSLPVDPLVLSLPEVPDGAVALIGNATGRRYTRYLKTDSWCDGEGAILPFGILLPAEDGSVTVEMAPPREPRTWPRLDDIPDDLKAVKGASGKVYRRHSSGFDQFGEGMCSIGVLQRIDGPLTEVFDNEPRGEQR